LFLSVGVEIVPAKKFTAAVFSNQLQVYF